MAAFKNKDNGTWYVQFRYTDWRGERQQKLKRGFHTKKAALAWEREFLMKKQADLNMTLESFVELYTQDVKPKLKLNTWLTKESIIQKKILPYLGKRKLSEITPQDIFCWQNEIRKITDKQGKPLSTTYLKTIHNQMSAIFNHAVRYYGLQSNPAAKAGSMGEKEATEMQFWTKEEFLKVIDAMMDSPIHYYAFEILSAVMHADERNRAMSEALGEDVYHYHLHVVYIPVVEKQILWSKRCKDKSLVGTVKEAIMQVSSSKKWQSQPSLDENGNPVLTAKGKPILKKSYSILQDDFFNAMRAAGYTDVERGERGSTEEHLTVTQFKVAQESARLEILEAQVEKKEQQLQKIEQKTRIQKATAVTLAEIGGMGRKTFTGKLELTPQEGETLKQLAKKGVVADAVISDLKQKLTSARKDARIWKERYEKLLEQTKDFLAAVKRAPEKVRAFLDRILHTERTEPKVTKQRETTLTK